MGSLEDCTCSSLTTTRVASKLDTSRSAMDPVDSPSSPFACSECKTRKVKCDKTKPTCHRCIRDGAGCHYPTARKRPPPLPSRPQVQEMENRLGTVLMNTFCLFAWVEVSLTVHLS